MLILDDQTDAGVPQPATGPAVEVGGLTKVYPGGKRALDDVSFSVDRGEIFGFLGPNGSGKTTAVRILVTLLRQTSGIARVGGFDVNREAGQVRRVIGYAGQFTGVDDDLTALENLALSGILHSVPHDECFSRAEALLEAFSLSDVADVRAGRLSGGMRRRLDLAQALVHRPSVLFLDEPTTGLDPQSRNALWDLLRDLAAHGTTVFLTTQYLEEADRACDRVAIIDNGRLVTIGTPRALKDEVGGGRLVLSLANSSDTDRASNILGSRPEVTRIARGEMLTAYVDDPKASAPALLKVLDAENIAVARVEQAMATLDDVFLRYTGERPRAEARVEGAVSSMFRAVHGKRRH
jgi:daunorubicin resistance ABC transporter ATP-binding subunit